MRLTIFVSELFVCMLATWKWKLVLDFFVSELFVIALLLGNMKMGTRVRISRSTCEMEFHKNITCKNSSLSALTWPDFFLSYLESAHNERLKSHDMVRDLREELAGKKWKYFLLPWGRNWSRGSLPCRTHARRMHTLSDI